MKSRTLPALLLAAATLTAQAQLPGPQGADQSGKPTVVPTTPPTSQAPTAEKVLTLTQLPRLADFIAADGSMRPTPALAAQLTHIQNFVQTAPTDGKPATQATDVWLGHSASAVTFIFLCHDDHPNLIRTHLSRRENLQQDDNVSVLLDTFEDHRRGTLFQVNPTGIQADAAWTENSQPDYSYDQVWDSSATLTRSGWIAILTIPYRSLRFRPGVQGWGVVLGRSIPRNSEQDYWPHIATNIAGTLTQEGTLHGIEGVTGSHNLQLNPYALAQNVHTLNSLDASNPFFSNRKLEATAGGDAKAILHDSVVLDATINPDFSQVESDQPQFTVNQRYPVYFPELRPFFLENANYFATPINLLYTRNIVHPEFGGRLTGRLGHTNLGLLTIDDRAPGEAYAPGDPLFGHHALFAVGRISEDFGKGSSLGLIYTDQEFAGSFNRIGGIDFTARFNDHWTAQGQAVESASRALPTPGTPTPYSAGPASSLEVTRSGHTFSLDNLYRDFSTGFQTQTGFIQTADIRSDNLNLVYQWYPQHSRVQNYGLQLQQQVAFDHQGDRVYHYSQLTPFVGFARNLTLVPILGVNSDTLTPSSYPVLPQNHNFSEDYAGGVVRGAPFRQLNFNLLYLQSGNVNYNPIAGAPPALLHQNYVQAYVTLQPFRSFTADNTYLLDRDFTASNGVFAFENQTLRTKLNYQFTRAFSARVIVEYDSTLANPTQTSLIRTKEVSTEALLTYLPHPGTAIYLGYNNDLQNLNHNFCNAGITDSGTPDPLPTSCSPGNPAITRSNNYLNDGRQIFLKVSYLLRF